MGQTQCFNWPAHPTPPNKREDWKVGSCGRIPTFPTFLRSDPKCRMYQNGMVLGCGGTGLVPCPGTFRGVQGGSGSVLGLRHPGVCEWSWMNVEMKLGFF